MDTNYEAQEGGTVMQSEPQSGIGAQMVGVFTSPSSAFEEYVKKPNWWLPLIIVIIGTMVFSVLSQPYQARLQYDIVKTSKTIPPQALEKMRSSMENPSYVGTIIGGAIVSTVIGVIIALIAWGIGSFIFGGQSGFLAVWGVTLMGSFITVLDNLIKVPLMMAKDTALVSIGPAALFPDKGPTSILFLFMMFLDVFVIWSMIVTGIGYAKAMKISNGSGITASVIATLVFIFAMMGLQLIGMKFAGIETTWF